MVCPLGFVGSEWILLGVSKWSDLESIFFLKTRISPTFHVTISMSWHAIWIEWDGYCRMGWITVGSEYYGILISLDIMGSSSIWSPFTGYGSSGVTITIHGEFLFDLYLNKSIPMNIGSNLLVKKDPLEPVDDQLFPCLFVAHWFAFILIIPCSMNHIKAFVWCKFYRKPLYSMAKNPWESPWFPAVWKSLAPGASCTRTAWGEHFLWGFQWFHQHKMWDFSRWLWKCWCFAKLGCHFYKRLDLTRKELVIDWQIWRLKHCETGIRTT